MPKEPKLVTCTFLKAWRGHAQGAVANLTPERAAELLEEGTVVEGERKLKAKGPDAPEGDTTTGDAGGDPPAGGKAPKAAKGGKAPKTDAPK